MSKKIEPLSPSTKYTAFMFLLTACLNCIQRIILTFLFKNVVFPMPRDAYGHYLYSHECLQLLSPLTHCVTSVQSK